MEVVEAQEKLRMDNKDEENIGCSSKEFFLTWDSFFHAKLTGYLG